MRLLARWLVPPAAVLAVGTPVGALARPPNSGVRPLAAPSCAAQGFGSGGVTYPGDPPPGVTTFQEMGATFTLTRADGTTLSWTSTAPIAAVLVRGSGAVQPWPAGDAKAGTGVRPPTDGSTFAPVDAVTLCFADPPAPSLAPPDPLVLAVVAQGTFTRAPAAVSVAGVVTITNPNDRSVPVDGLVIEPSTQGTCRATEPIEVPRGNTPVAFDCAIDIPDAARRGSVDVTARSASATGDATATVVWVERR